MPIDLTNIPAATAAASAVNPKWFHDDLTGNGRGVGLINQRLTPTSQPDVPSSTVWCNSHERIEIDADHTMRMIPIGIIPTVNHSGGSWIMDTGRELLDIKTKQAGVKVALGVTPQTALIHYNRDPFGKASRRLSFLYRLELYVVPAAYALTPADPIEAVLLGQRTNTASPMVIVRYAANNVRAEIDTMLDRCPVPIAPHLQELEDWLEGYSVFDQLCALAERWTDAATGDLLSMHLNSLMTTNVIAAEASARYLENYNLPLDAYGTINAQLIGTADNQDRVRHQNLNLLMYATLNDLIAVKDQLPVPPSCTVPRPPRASDEQWAATTSEAPLSLVAAGAGSGKTTTILARIVYLQQMGIDLSKVMVLSFTNAAAQNVLERNHGVKSLTIAAMILNIYQANHPEHRLSTIDTICNSLKIFPDTAYQDLDQQLAFALRQVDGSANSRQRASAPMVDLATFISNNTGWVINRLDTIGQTCLELTMIISYLTRDSIVIPPEVATEYLIVDEVQDTSLFEFAYLMTFAREQRANLFMVGDPSQTLYEFRGTDPRALMILATNDDFVNYALNTNYRSNQQILDFANIQLGELDTNQGLGIQLRSNLLLNSSEAAFKESVQLRTIFERTEREFVKSLARYTESIVRPYVEACLDRGEQVAVIAPTRAMGTIMETRLAALFPKARIDNITSARRVTNQTFSRFINHQWQDVVAIGPTSASLAIVKLIGANLHLYGPRWGDDAAKSKVLTEFLSKWWLDQSPMINALVAATVSGQISSDSFFDRLRDLLLQYEIQVNAAAQAALQVRNQTRKQMPGKPDIVVSTIHGVKGLEFDNVVVINNEAHNLVQTTKRMAYVALTRAKKTELVIAFRTTKNSMLRDAHEALAKLYWQQDYLESARTNGVPVDTMSEDEIVALLEDAAKDREEHDTEISA